MGRLPLPVRYAVLAAALALLLALPRLLDNAYYVHIANLTLINVILVTGLNVITRTGQLSLCHAAFAGIGGVCSRMSTTGNRSSIARAM